MPTLSTLSVAFAGSEWGSAKFLLNEPEVIGILEGPPDKLPIFSDIPNSGLMGKLK